MGRGKSYSVEYKNEIVNLIVKEGKKLADVARNIDVNESTIRGWIRSHKNHGEEAFPGKGNLRTEDNELRKLKKEMADLREENAILKKAITIFTNPAK